MTNLCIHCDQPAFQEYFHNDQKVKIGPFCCQGCLTVFNIIKDKGLSEYYDIKKNVALFKPRAPVEDNHNQKNHYQYLDNEDFLREYSYATNDENAVMEFYLEGVHCLACLWIIEKLNEFVPGVKSSKLNLSRSVVTIVLQKNGKFQTAAKELELIGYKAHPLKINQTEKDLKTKENRLALLRIGIAGASAGNIMMYAISLYAGADERYQQAFNALTVVFALPAMTFSAWPFYQSSWTALKNKTLSIDVPIAMSLIMGLIMGIYNLVMGIPDNYFDSLTALVFLLLLSRYFLKLIQEKGLSTNDLHFFYQKESIQKVINLETLECATVHPKFIKTNDIIRICQNDIIPSDGIIYKGETHLDYSLLTGESDFVKKTSGDQVYSGVMNMGADIYIKVTNVASESRIGKILKQVENGWSQKAKIVEITNKVSVYFVLAVLVLTLGLFFKELTTHPLPLALEKALTLLIVTCPCALAIAIPLTFIKALSENAKKGIIIKDDAVIENMAKAKNIFIDKTGTRTESKLSIVDIANLDMGSISISTIVHLLEKTTRHPVGLALKNHFPLENPSLVNDLKLTDFIETPGVGVSGKINEHFYEIKSNKIFEDGKCLLEFNTRALLKKDARATILSLKKLGLNICLLSGDKFSNVARIAHELGLKDHEFQAELSPEDKCALIKKYPQSIMVGDGVNDSIALSTANVGIAVHGAMELSLRACDLYLSTPNINSLSSLIISSRETMKIIYRNLILSLSYNSVSVILAFAGLISPLTAAIIMPLSSVTVLISSLYGTKITRALWK